MMKIRINLVSKQKGSRIVSYIAILSIAAAVVFTFYNINSFIRNIQYINKLKDRVSSLEHRLPEGYGKYLQNDSEAKVMKKDVEFINSFAERKALGWTGLLTALEIELPKSVYLVQVRPDAMSQTIEINGVARDMNGALATVERLSQGSFDAVYLKGHSKDKDDGRLLFHLSAVYRGAR